MEELLIIGGVEASVIFDPDIAMFRGEFHALSGGADFYASTHSALVAEGLLSLETYMDACRENGIAPVHKPMGD